MVNSHLAGSGFESSPDQSFNSLRYLSNLLSIIKGKSRNCFIKIENDATKVLSCFFNGRLINFRKLFSSTFLENHLLLFNILICPSQLLVHTWQNCFAWDRERERKKERKENERAEKGREREGDVCACRSSRCRAVMECDGTLFLRDFVATNLPWKDETRSVAFSHIVCRQNKIIYKSVFRKPLIECENGPFRWPKHFRFRSNFSFKFVFRRSNIALLRRVVTSWRRRSWVAVLRGRRRRKGGLEQAAG